MFIDYIDTSSLVIQLTMCYNRIFSRIRYLIPTQSCIFHTSPFLHDFCLSLLLFWNNSMSEANISFSLSLSLAASCSMCDLSSQTRRWTGDPAVEAQDLNYRNSGEVTEVFWLSFFSYPFRQHLGYIYILLTVTETVSSHATWRNWLL